MALINANALKFIYVYDDKVEVVRNDVIIETYLYNETLGGFPVTLYNELCENLVIVYKHESTTVAVSTSTSGESTVHNVIDKEDVEPKALKAQQIADAILLRIQECEKKIGGSVEISGSFLRVFKYDEFTIKCEYVSNVEPLDTYTIICYDEDSNIGIRHRIKKRNMKSQSNVEFTKNNNLNKSIDLDSYNALHLINNKSNVIDFVNDIRGVG